MYLFTYIGVGIKTSTTIVKLSIIQLEHILQVFSDYRTMQLCA